MQRLASILSFAALTALASAQFSIVIPNGFAAAEAGSNNAFPWGRGGGGIRIQTIYDSSHFTLQGVNFPVLISGLRWRPNANTASLATSYTTGGTVKLSTSPVDQGSTTTTFANQIGADETTCFSGPVSWPAAAATPGPCPFLVDIPFTTNFLYDPSLGGDLNIETELPIQTFSGSALQLDVSTAAAQACRLVLTAGYVPGGPTGIVTLNHGVVVEVIYTPAAGLYSSFTSDVTGGVSPLAVNFTDTTFTSDPNGVTSWSWDFDGDNVVDSNLQNPTFVYTACGDYNVTLTTTDGSHAPSVVTRTAYIKTDVIAPDFTHSLLVAPNIIQFTDTTTPAATAWDWDFDGDNITDSTAQNPVWVLPLCSVSNVRLTATRACRTSTKATPILIAPNTLSTLFSGGNTGAANWTVFYDVNVTNPTGVNICGLATNSATVANTPFSLELYVTPTSYVGKDGTPAAWRLAGIASGLTRGTNLPSLAAMGSSVYLPTGSFGLALRYIGASPSYTNGPLGPYSNADLTMTLGASRSTTGVFTGGSLFTSRIWNGTIFYDTMTTGATAGYGFFGAGCPGSLGISALSTSGARPQIGSVFNVTMTNLPTSSAIMMTGFSNTFSVFGALPLDVTPYGAPGCFGRVSTDATLFLAGAANQANWVFGIPNNTSYLGVLMYNQALVLDPGFNALGAVLGDAAALMIGN